MAEHNRELADFLRRARGRIDPTRAGVPSSGGVRRVPGLRREEVALLAGVSADYYTRLEQGRRISPSASVVEALARALDLDAAGRTHLRDLFGPSARTEQRLPAVQRARPGVHQVLDAVDGLPAFVLGRRGDVLATNRMSRALLADFDRMRPRERNYARWMFLDERARALFLDWEEQARAAVESLRLAVGTDPHDRAAQELVDELSAASGRFSRWWDEHGVFQRTHGSKRLRHPVVGDLTVDYETLTFPDDPHQTLFVYTTEAGTSSREAMDLLGSWSLTRTGAAGAPPARPRQVLPPSHDGGAPPGARA
ncbi:MAG: Putative DNA-binding protein [uncultured Quadrisphaera sp.]|uniref:DNA-binding protein n=1 Tax=uncultured Quadrisphaera sp. TaxID=904978 RepID=A0A6J4QEL3_9ACTN|nr:MAG: Putative DNA-binding protein [uncultured Quadrisphaera sp.]